MRLYYIYPQEEREVEPLFCCVAWNLLKKLRKRRERWCLRDDVEGDGFNCLGVGVLQESLDQNGPLNGEYRGHEIQTHTVHPIAAGEGHQETKANEEHDVHVLEEPGKKKGNRFLCSSQVKFGF